MTAKDWRDFSAWKLREEKRLCYLNSLNPRKRHDRGKLTTPVYEALEDIGTLEAAMAVLARVHRDDEDFRKARWMIGRLALKIEGEMLEELKKSWE